MLLRIANWQFSSLHSVDFAFWQQGRRQSLYTWFADLENVSDEKQMNYLNDNLPDVDLLVGYSCRDDL